MATIYRFIVEQQQGRASSGRNSSGTGSSGSKKNAKEKTFTLMGTLGVEHNRKMRAINPILNKVTGGVWEKGMRLTRAGAGLVKRNTETGKLSLSGPSIAIIIAFVLITVWNGIAKWNARERANAAKLNAQNFKAMENGSGTVHGAYSIAVNGWSGHISYNENK